MRKPISRARGKTIVRPKSDCAIIPKKRKGETRFDSFQQFVFETVFRLIAPHVADSRMTAAEALPKFQALGFESVKEVVSPECSELFFGTSNVPAFVHAIFTFSIRPATLSASFRSTMRIVGRDSRLRHSGQPE